METIIPLVGVIAALAGAIVGGSIAFLNSRLQLREQRKRERNKLILSKLEEIHQALSQFRDSYNAQSLDRILTTQNVETPQQVKEGTAKVPIERLQMLIGFYAPELSDHLKMLEQSRKEYGDVLIKTVGLERKNEIAKRETLGALTTEWRKVEKTCVDMQAEVIRMSKKYL